MNELSKLIINLYRLFLINIYIYLVFYNYYFKEFGIHIDYIIKLLSINSYALTQKMSH